MSRFSAVALVLAVLLASVVACAKRAAEPQPPAVVIAPEPEDDGTIPPPRPLPLAAEPSDAQDAMEVFVISGADHSWKVQYPQGQRLIVGGKKSERMVLPANVPVKFTCTAEKGETTFEIPAFPVLIDAKADQYASRVVKPIRAGEFAIYHGPDRVGTALVAPREEFDAWLHGRLMPGLPGNEPPAQVGRQLFLKLQCIRCHSGQADAKAPNLEGLYGTKVKLVGGGIVVADDQYIIESIRRPRAKIVDGWEVGMPAYDEEHLSNEELNALIAYLRVLKPGGLKAKEERFPPPVGAPK